VIIKTSEFEISAVRPNQWIEDGLPEFAFIGRSNVGKSSLLNRLLNRKSLARVSRKPGKTQQINFFRINDQFRFIDLPGYGYANVSKGERKLFLKLISTYLTQRIPLQRVVHLIDIRHDPSVHDVEVHQWLLQLGRPMLVVATKSDKISKSQIQKNVEKIRTILQTPFPVIPVSSEKSVGIDALWAVLENDLQDLLDDSSFSEVAPTDTGLSNEHAQDDEYASD